MRVSDLKRIHDSDDLPEGLPRGTPYALEIRLNTDTLTVTKDSLQKRDLVPHVSPHHVESFYTSIVCVEGERFPRVNALERLVPHICRLGVLEQHMHKEDGQMDSRITCTAVGDDRDTVIAPSLNRATFDRA